MANENEREKRETLADIVAEMRKRKEMLITAILSTALCNPVDRMEAQADILDEFADRIEAAWKREREAVGNAAATRDALNDIVGIAKIALSVNCVGNNNDSELWNIIDKAKAALSAPPRQCDVGTPEEQSDRFANFCDSHSACSQCPVKSRWNFANGHKPSCGVLWAQMPYEAKEGGAE